MRNLTCGVLALTLLLPLVSAQGDPGAPGHPEVLGFDFSFQDDAYKTIPFLKGAYFNFTITDLSRDSTAAPEIPLPTFAYSPNVHMTQVTATVQGVNGEEVKGWNILGSGVTFFTIGGESRQGSIRLDAGPGAAPNYVRVLVNATFLDPATGTNLYGEHVLNAQLAPYWNGYAQVLQVQTKAGQDDIVNIPVRIENRATYIDTYLLNVTGPDDFLTTIPARVTIGPESSATVNLTIRTPKGKPYELLRIEQFTVNARSLNEPNVVYPASAIVQVQGPYIAKQWIPMAFLVGLCAVLLQRHRGDKRERRRGEEGGPRRPRVKPKQAVLLAHLKRTDPEAYKERREKLQAIYAQRRQTYKEHVKEERAREKTELKQAQAEAKEERKRRKAQRKEDRKLQKIQRKEDKKKRKEERKRLKVLKKERAKVEKKLEKAKAKKEKAEAKEAKKRAKLEAKEAKARARAERKAARAKGKK